MDNDLFDQAVILLKAGDKQGAEKLFLQLANQEPDDENVWYGLALCEDDKKIRESSSKMSA